jgi:hypothetical protein
MLNYRVLIIFQKVKCKVDQINLKPEPEITQHFELYILFYKVKTGTVYRKKQFIV